MIVVCHSDEGRNTDYKDKIISFAQRKNIIVSTIFLIGFFLCISCCCNNVGDKLTKKDQETLLTLMTSSNKASNKLSKKDQETLLTLTKLELAKEKIDINEYNVHFSEHESIALVVCDRKDYNYDQYGGGATLVFKKYKDGYKFMEFIPMQ